VDKRVGHPGQLLRGSQKNAQADANQAKQENAKHGRQQVLPEFRENLRRFGALLLHARIFFR
jgi:hypothetical protein